MKIIEFKTVSPLFEMERDGIKPFTERLVDMSDPRFKTVIYGGIHDDIRIKITNPSTSESFTRKFLGQDRLPKNPKEYTNPKWIILYLGELVSPDK